MREVTAEELDNEEDDLILFYLKMHLEGNNETVKASTLLGNKDRIKKVCQVFGPSSQQHEMQEINDNMKIQADYLHSLLLSRLACYIRRIIDDKQKREHWCLQWAGKNMTHMAVIMLMIDHVKDDLFCLHEDTKILKMHEIFVETNDER